MATPLMNKGGGERPKREIDSDRDALTLAYKKCTAFRQCIS